MVKLRVRLQEIRPGKLIIVSRTYFCKQEEDVMKIYHCRKQLEKKQCSRF